LRREKKKQKQVKRKKDNFELLGKKRGKITRGGERYKRPICSCRGRIALQRKTIGVLKSSTY